MPAALLIPGLVFFGALVLVSIAQTMNVTTKAQTEAQQNIWGFLRDAITGKATVKAITRATRSAISRWALSQMKPLARWFTALAILVQRIYATQGDFAEGVADAFAHLRHRTIPQAVGIAVAPVKVGVKTAQHAATKAGAHATTIAHDVTRLRSNVIPRVRAAERAIAVTLPREIAHVNKRVGTVEREIEHPNHGLLSRWAKWLWAAGLAGLFIRTLARRFPWLFCRKVRSIGNRICGLDDGLLQALLQDTLLLAGTVSLVEFVRDAQAVERVAIGAVHDFLRDV